jgi:hypothetical protein
MCELKDFLISELVPYEPSVIRTRLESLCNLLQNYGDPGHSASDIDKAINHPPLTVVRVGDEWLLRHGIHRATLLKLLGAHSVKCRVDTKLENDYHLTVAERLKAGMKGLENVPIDATEEAREKRNLQEFHEIVGVAPDERLFPAESVKFIISGVPSSGKTTFGDWLRDRRSFTHINLEQDDEFTRQAVFPNLQSLFPDWLDSITSNVVVTWGFPPTPECFALIERFKEYGYSAWWFEADTTVARNLYVQSRGEDATRQFFDVQIQRLRESEADIERIYGGKRITTLTTQGHVAPEDILTTLQEARPELDANRH